MRRFSFLLAGLIALAAPARAADRFEGPPPWRVGGPVGCTVDVATFPDSGRLVMDVSVRIPPATLVQLDRDDGGDARIKADFRVRGRFASQPIERHQEFALDHADTALGQGRVIRMRFPAAPGPCRVEVRLTDLNSRRQGLLYAGREVNESAQIIGDVEVPRPQAGRDISDLLFLWPSAGADSAFLHLGRAHIPNPDRLYGLFAPTLRAAFVVRGKSGSTGAWHWVARVFDAKEGGVAQVESTAVAGPLLDAELAIDLAGEPAGAYDLDVKAWQDGDAGAVERRARFSIAWKADTWRRSPADLTDESHFLLATDDEDAFALMPPGEQERFLEDFWGKRDPISETPQNEAYETFRARVAHANEVWTHGRIEKGMFTDMGRTYIRYGEPSEVLHQVIPTGDETLTQQLQEIITTEDRPVGDVNTKGPGGDMRPFEVWVYEGDIPLPFDADPTDPHRGRQRRRLLFLFVDEHGTGLYQLKYSTE